MQIATFSAIIENGQVRFVGDVHLPEKTKVYVVVPDLVTTPRKKITLAELVAQMPDDYVPSEEESYVTTGYGNYTEERRELFANRTLDDLLDEIKQRRINRPTAVEAA